MGLKGTKPSADIDSRNRRIWREYLQLRALNYYATAEMMQMVADKMSVSFDVVKNVIYCTKPDGCLKE